MTSRLHFELFMLGLRVRASENNPKQLPCRLLPDGTEDVGSVRLSQIASAMKETRAGRSDK